MPDKSTQDGLFEWYDETTGGDSINAIAQRSGVWQATLNRQVAGRNLSPETVVKIARAYGVSVLDGLIAQGLISPIDVATTAALDALMDATDEQLLGEIARRLMDASDEHDRLREPADNVIPADNRFGAFHAPEGVERDLEEYVADVRRDHNDDPTEP